MAANMSSVPLPYFDKCVFTLPSSDFLHYMSQLKQNLPAGYELNKCCIHLIMCFFMAVLHSFSMLPTATYQIT